MIIKVTRMTGETAPADSSGDPGIGGGTANINLAPVATGGVNGGVLTIVFSKVSRNTASGRPGSDEMGSSPSSPGGEQSPEAEDLLRGRFASLDTAATPDGWQLSRRTGRSRATGDRCRSSRDRRAISVPLTPVTKGLSRSPTGSPPRSSGYLTARMAQIPKLIVRVRFPSPAPTEKSQFRGPICERSASLRNLSGAIEYPCGALQIALSALHADSADMPWQRASGGRI